MCLCIVDEMNLSVRHGKQKNNKHLRHIVPKAGPGL